MNEVIFLKDAARQGVDRDRARLCLLCVCVHAERWQCPALLQRCVASSCLPASYQLPTLPSLLTPPSASCPLQPLPWARRRQGPACVFGSRLFPACHTTSSVGGGGPRRFAFPEGRCASTPGAEPSCPFLCPAAIRAGGKGENPLDLGADLLALHRALRAGALPSTPILARRGALRDPDPGAWKVMRCGGLRGPARPPLPPPPPPKRLRCGSYRGELQHTLFGRPRDGNLGKRACYGPSAAGTSSARSGFNGLGMEGAFSMRWL